MKINVENVQLYQGNVPKITTSKISPDSSISSSKSDNDGKSIKCSTSWEEKMTEDKIKNFIMQNDQNVSKSLEVVDQAKEGVSNHLESQSIKIKNLIQLGEFNLSESLDFC